METVTRRRISLTNGAPGSAPGAPDVLEDQATKGGGWMPWGQEPKKGAAHCEKPRGAASTLGSVDTRMRQRPFRDGKGPRKGR